MEVWSYLAKYKKRFIKLDLKIPDTIVVIQSNNYCYLSYDPKKRGIIRKSELEININDFERIAKSKIDYRYLDEDYYLFVQRTPNYMEFAKTVFTKKGW